MYTGTRYVDGVVCAGVHVVGYPLIDTGTIVLRTTLVQYIQHTYMWPHML